ncbi:hypothetical protein M8I34_25940 [Streptomyces sp. MCA2]|uniref:hypothetical protein n=1 Tax=Streptomyces sp. MCA2 TaxID=2944805 RepID=UPI0020224E0F|nr:hypothetical protein [Streptomyces sp. MCA2]MCL7494815.1 hypothetical protein [Streptomyces sp. MCA2]
MGGTHGKGQRPVVEVGAHVAYRGQTWQVAALQGQQVYLLQEDGTETRLLLGRLFADPGFEVVGARAPDAVPQWGLFETVPVAAQQRALAWLPHIREVETGWPHPEGGRDGQTMRPEYDPERWTLALRDAAKAKELAALGFARVTRTAVLEDGSLGRPELTIAVDVATRSILAAVLRPHSTKAVDAALLLAEMAVPHPARPGWPKSLHLSRAEVPYQRMLSLDERLEGAAARPVIVPETIVVDRGKIYLSQGFVAACETLGVSVQPAPPRRPQAKAVVERTFGSINDLFCQHVAGHTGSSPQRRGSKAAAEARWTIPQLQDFLDEWITCGWQNRPHDGLRHPVLPKTALTPNQMWAALITISGYVPVPLTEADYLELLPVRWQPITERGIRLDYRTYNHDILDPHRSERSPVEAKDGKWELHHNPHDARQIWVRLTDGQLHEVPWIHRDHVHQPFNDSVWRHIQTEVEQRGDRDQHEADLADALDQLLRRTRSSAGTEHETGRREKRRARSMAMQLPDLPGQRRPLDTETTPAPDPDWSESLDDLIGIEVAADAGTSEPEGASMRLPAEAGGYGLWDAEAEAEQW